MTDLSQVQAAAQAIQQNIEKVIVGKSSVVELLTVALLTPGHVLIEDVPGLAKTMLAKSLAKSLGCSFQRVQFTPDLLPSDITGVSIFNQKTQEFEYRAGPLMSQIILADEINRAGPRTQSALLEAMEERQVTVDGITRSVPLPFLVVATQNPDRVGGHVPAARSAARSFLAARRDRLSRGRRRTRSAAPLPRSRSVGGTAARRHRR